MKKIPYSAKQIEELLANPYVKNCSERYITFTTECKIEFLNLSKQWFFYKDIFKKFGFLSYIVNSDIPKNSCTRWNRNLASWILEWKKGKPKNERKEINQKDIESMSLKEQNIYLQAENAYLKELHKTIYWHYP